MKTVALLDYGAGNIRSACRALERVGAQVEITQDPHIAVEADGLLVPGVGAYAACMQGLKAIRGDRIIGQRLAGSRPVFGICVGMQILFDQGVEHGQETQGCGQWPGVVEQLKADILPHMGWNTVVSPEQSELFSGLDAATRYYFVHSFGVRRWDFVEDGLTQPPLVTWAQHEDDRFIAAIENGPLWATQFHPEKSGDAGAQLLENWLAQL
ncbi:imidazole glycerol phosphate synthase subunit HisH [Corynebacterium sp. sy017]|uniref:imidazole glycerol phosphate synthase subunit HisH n=1 Tax=unclassified Corynebacterium TaxID=2624378 RepID=UPI001184B623|nr:MULTISPECIES: imidazole glycerol phosphate synthase subunit HisH [unclassified Corynebacterium]MBP3087922.1 imidazole glycerol phosphate synthase subunit HisH [Corynebacterium sp. sy017]QDZ43567.1 imidazole glycerol phosphate synthase subunit HisH [Corynebacterium sp. sy039]TSD92745.1 imidazole glycerol phosphate synthase subunit HisH [Corynebacterium sp. SY003]